MIQYIFGLYLMTTAQLGIPAIDSDLEWKTKHTEHFKIHYSAELEEVANKIAGISEPVFDQLTTKMRWTPSNPVHVVLLNNVSDANGFSTPLPYNSLYLNVAPPSEGSSLDYYDDFLTMLFTHELTHTIHIDMYGGINTLFRTIFGRVWVPNAIQPQWLIEGLAMYNETTETTKGRGRSPYIDMYMRTVTLENEFQPIERATYWNDSFPYGNSAYWYGVAFHFWLIEKYGEEAVISFAHKNSKWPFFGWLNFKTRSIFGKSFDRLWEEWRLEEQSKWKQLVSQYSPQTKPEKLSENEELLLIGRGVWAPDQNKFYSLVTESFDTKLVSYEPNASSTEFKEETVKDGFAARRLTYSPGYLFYAKSGPSSRFNNYSDLYVFDLDKKESTQLTRGLRLHDPVQLASGEIIAVHVAEMRSSLVKLKPLDFKAEDFEPLETESWQTLFKMPNFGTINSPQVSPDGQTLVFEMLSENQFRDLYSMSIADGRVSRLTQDSYDELFPVFHPTKNEVIFTSDRPLGGSPQRVYNLFSLNLDTRILEQQTDVWSGAYWPVTNGRKILYGEFTSRGFEPRFTDWKAAGIQRSPLKTEAVVTASPKIISSGLTPSSEIRTTDYEMGYTLLPRYLLPFWFITEDDTAIGLITGSNDPLAFHRYTAFGYYYTSPQRPGGVFSYTYTGFNKFYLHFSASAGIRNYGDILLVQEPGSSDITFGEYYERDFFTSLGAGYSPDFKGFWSNFRLFHGLFFEHRRPLLALPAGTLRTVADVRAVFPNLSQTATKALPEKGNQIGISTQITWSPGIAHDPDGINPKAGSIVQVGGEYAPKFTGSDFETLTTTLRARQYLEFLKDHSVALEYRLGIQWLDPLYQRTFRLGGSFGQSDLPFIGFRSYALRGIDEGLLRGEGVTAASLEYRFPLLKWLPGFGTAPLWVKNIHGALFTDAGQAFQHQKDETVLARSTRKFKFSRMTQTVGAELKSDISVSYGPPVSFRLGYGRVVYLVGDYIFGDNESQVYFRLGTSF